jgi:hypothetical protein
VNSQSTLSLSALDLMTCGFGGVILVFLILLATQDRLAEPQPTESPGRASERVAPFALIVETEGDGPLIVDPRIDPWVIDGSGLAGAQTGLGQRKALLTATSPPTDGVIIRFGPIEPGRGFHVVAIRPGAKRVTLGPDQAASLPRDGSGRITLWPGPLSPPTTGAPPR